MSLITTDLLLRKAELGRCLQCGVAAGDYELYCGSCGPTGLTRVLSADNKATVKSVVRVVRDSKTRINESGSARRRVQGWLARLIARGEDSLESVIHAYMYVFWCELLFPGVVMPPNRHGAGNVYFTSESLPDCDDAAIKDEEKLVSIYKRQARVDLVATDGPAQAIYLLEVKRGGLDDRAVGQLLRYYDHWSRSLPTAECRMLNFNYIKPILILDQVSHAEWRSLPQFFRDVVEVYRYSVGEDGVTIALHNARKHLVSPR